MSDRSAVNVGILGGVGYLAYDNWNRPWDRRTASAIGVGLMTLIAGEGLVLYGRCCYSSG
jgi:hypothetical protein